MCSLAVKNGKPGHRYQWWSGSPDGDHPRYGLALCAKDVPGETLVDHAFSDPQNACNDGHNNSPKTQTCKRFLKKVRIFGVRHSAIRVDGPASRGQADTHSEECGKTSAQYQTTDDNLQ